MISLAVAAVFAAPVVASAGTETYGLAHVAVGFVDNDAPGGVESSSSIMTGNNSNIGFKAKHYSNELKIEQKRGKFLWNNNYNITVWINIINMVYQ